MLVFNFLESFLDIIVLVGEKWGGGQWWGRYTINFLDSAGVLLVVHLFTVLDKKRRVRVEKNQGK